MTAMKVLVIGGGAAGMMAAIRAAELGAEVILAEKNEKLGKKLYITGKGRCNLTNACTVEDFFSNVVSNPKFLYSAVYGFDQNAVCAFLESEGLRLKEERGQRVFPASDKSSDVIRALEKALREQNVDIRLHTEIASLTMEGNCFVNAQLSDGATIAADAVIIATGGLSYRSTGSTGDGYRFAEMLGHKIVSCEPSLVPLRVQENWVSELEGLSLRNVSVTMDRYQGFGEMLFTSDGISGPLILSASATLCRRIAMTPEGIPLRIDLKPSLTMEQLDQRILRDFQKARNKDFQNALAGLLPAKLIPVMVRMSGIEPHKKVHEITRQERSAFAGLLKSFPLTVIGTKGFSQAVITQGGVCVKEVDPRTMRSKKAANVYFAGEVLDVDAYTGGFNLQIAWSTGYLAGEAAATS